MTIAKSRPRRAAAAGLVACALVAAGCGDKADPLEIGLKRVALDLAFRDADKALPVDAPRVIRQVIEDDFEFVDFDGDGIFEEEEEEPERPRRRTTAAPPRLQPAPPCEVGDLGVAPQRNAFAVVKDPPKVGQYPRHNTGTITISPTGAAAAASRSFPYPPRSAWQIPRVDFRRDSVVLGPDEEKTVSGLNPPPQVSTADAAFPNVVEFELRRMIGLRDGTIDTFQYTPPGATGGSYLYLIKRVTLTGGEESAFTPTPPIRYIELNVPEGPDSAVNHAGTDRSTNVAMSVQSQVVNREVVDVCGEIVDTFRVQISETLVDLSGSEPRRGGNPPDAPTFWNIVFDDGLLIVREEAHVIRQISVPDPVSGQRIPIDIRLDYVSVLDDVAPKPLPAGSPGATTATTQPAGGDEEEE